jgi:branched-chain amino acid transport system substrate-binding protein
VIGAAMALTGVWNQITDQPVIEGLKLGVRDINKKGGVDGRLLKVIYADTKSQIPLVGAAAERVLAQKADVVITTCDYDFGGPAARVANKRGVLAIGCAAAEQFGLKGIGRLTFSINAGEPAEGASVADFAQKKGFKKAYVLTDPTIAYSKDQCKYAKQTFEKLAGANSIVGEDTFLQNDAVSGSVSTQIGRLKAAASKADVVFVCSYQPGAGAILRQIRAAGIKLPVVGGAQYEGLFWTNAVPGLSDVYHAGLGAIFGDDPRAAVNRFYKTYTKTYKKSPNNSYALFGYSIAELVASAVKKANSTNGAKLARALETSKNLPLLIGPTSFTRNCHQARSRPWVMSGWQNGKDHFEAIVKLRYVPPAIC